MRDSGWLRRHMPRDGSVTLTEVTSARAVINLCGPQSRAVIEKLADADLSNAAFPYMTMRELRVGYAPVRAARVTYVGELGYELHVPSEYAQHVYELLWEAGAAFGIANAGYRAIESCRLEKRYLYWGADITPDTNPYEAGLGFCVALGKGDFLGREALAKIKADGPRQRLCLFALTRDKPVYGAEAILHEGRVLGVTTSAGYGHTLGKYLAYGYVPAEDSRHADYEIESFGDRIPAQRLEKPPYDPERKRILG
jgi:4-methylaminobutanoate oxidase (formaldehyde-forming)